MEGCSLVMLAKEEARTAGYREICGDFERFLTQTGDGSQ